MGSIIRYTHKDCGFEYEFLEGVGFSTFAMQCKSREYMRRRRENLLLMNGTM